MKTLVGCGTTDDEEDLDTSFCCGDYKNLSQPNIPADIRGVNLDVISADMSPCILTSSAGDGWWIEIT